MELKEIRKKGSEELKKNLAEQREKLRELRFKVSTKQHKTVRDVRKIKQIIARILTVLKEREINPDADPAVAAKKSEEVNEKK